MGPYPKGEFVLIVEDDDDDYFLIQKAFQQIPLRAELRRVKNGEELEVFLYSCCPESGGEKARKLPLVLLDLNMPRKDGRQTLGEIKSHPVLRKVPIVVFTSSRDEEDVNTAYELGANSFLQKPDSFKALVELLDMLTRYWMGTARLPSLSEPRAACHG
ncbi:MAG: response regulator [Elusimicrobia bacterium]|nr:response regulator [Elusimicrobiota bacterium]